MKSICFNLVWFIMLLLNDGDIYSIHITTIDGQDKAMENFRGKRVLIAILPAAKTADDSAFLRTLTTISETYSDRLSVIAVPSVEDGYVNDRNIKLDDYYKSMLGRRITITQAMYTHKQSATQHALFAWLTNVDGNMHFDDDVSGPTQKFFVNEEGELYGVALPGGTLDEKVMQKMMQ